MLQRHLVTDSVAKHDDRRLTSGESLKEFQHCRQPMIKPSLPWTDVPVAICAGPKARNGYAPRHLQQISNNAVRLGLLCRHCSG